MADQRPGMSTEHSHCPLRLRRSITHPAVNTKRRAGVPLEHLAQRLVEGRPLNAQIPDVQGGVPGDEEALVQLPVGRSEEPGQVQDERLARPGTPGLHKAEVTCRDPALDGHGQLAQLAAGTPPAQVPADTVARPDRPGTVTGPGHRRLRLGASSPAVSP